MDPIKIGQWLITEDGIEWTGKIMNGYFIDKDRLGEEGPSERKDCYDWLLHLPEKNWVTEQDTYALNTAFLFAMEIFGVPLRSQSFEKTLQMQQQVLSYKADEEKSDKTLLIQTHPIG